MSFAVKNSLISGGVTFYLDVKKDILDGGETHYTSHLVNAALITTAVLEFSAPAIAGARFLSTAVIAQDASVCEICRSY